MNEELLRAHRELMLLRTAALVHPKVSARRRRKRKGMAAEPLAVREAYLRERELKLDEALQANGKET